MSASLVGTWMQNVAQSWLVYRLTHSELLLGATSFAQHLPTLLLGPLGGVLADRWPRRRIVFVTQSLFLLQAVALAWLTFSGQITVVHVMALASFAGLVNAFDVPARQSMLADLAGRENLLNAISLNSLMFNAARIVGPSIGGIIVAAFGEGFCFGLNATSFLAILCSLSFIRLPAPPPEPAAHPIEELRQGLAYVTGSPRVWPLLGVSAAVNISITPMLALLPMVADGLFQQGSRGVGFLTSALGAGAIAGLLGLAARRSQTGLARTTFFSTTLLGAAMVLFAFSPSYAFALLVMPLVGYSLMRQNASTNTQLQASVREEFRGRVMGLYSSTVMGMAPIGALAGGALASAAGVRWTVICAGLLCFAGGLLFRSQMGRGA